MQAQQDNSIGRDPGTGPLLLSIDDARRELGDIGKTTIFSMIAAGEIAAVKLGRRTMVLGESCRSLVASLPRVKTGEAA